MIPIFVLKTKFGSRVLVNMEDTDIKLFQCYQPQLANFNKRSLQQVVDSMGGKTFWIEEKLDGERIQLHKQGRRFQFFSRFSQTEIVPD